MLLRLPEGRAATLAYLKQLTAFERPWIHAESSRAGDTVKIRMNPALPQFSPGTEWALVRRMRTIDIDGNVRTTPVIQSIQLREVGRDEPGSWQFGGHESDPFEARGLAQELTTEGFRRRQWQVLRSCFLCHVSANAESVQSLNVIANDRVLSLPSLAELDSERLLQESVHVNSYQYGLLRGLWNSEAGPTADSPLRR